MKTTFLLLLPLVLTCTVSAQLTITAGAQFAITGNLQIALQNTDLVNNGNFTAGNSRIHFTGNAASNISGTQPVQFYEIEMNKANAGSVLLQRSISVSQRIIFNSGFLNLNDFNTDLGTTGFLEGEQENSRITGTNGGEVLFNTTLNTPAGVDPGALGIIITSSQNLGNVVIRRGHQSQVNGSGLGTSILRYYDVVPANNNNLNAALRFKYFDGELNGLDENSIVFFESPNNTNWTSLGFNLRDVNANFVEQTGINSFGRFTLSSLGGPLPVSFILFNIRCDGNHVMITWKTAQEQGSSHFIIQRSDDGRTWKNIGTVAAAGNSNNPKDYSFKDSNIAPSVYYRIAQYDLNGIVRYTRILRSFCAQKQSVIVWPNPVAKTLFISLYAANASEVKVKLFDDKGALVKEQRAAVLHGNNLLTIDVSQLPSAIYQLVLLMDKGSPKTIISIMKE